MNPKVRRALAIVALCFMPIFVVSLSLTLGFSDLLGGWMPAIAGISGGIAILLFLFLKMDESRTRRKEQLREQTEKAVAEGAERLDEDIEAGRAVDMTEAQPTDEQPTDGADAPAETVPHSAETEDTGAEKPTSDGAGTQA